MQHYAACGNSPHAHAMLLIFVHLLVHTRSDVSFLFCRCVSTVESLNQKKKKKKKGSPRFDDLKKKKKSMKFRTT